MNKTEAAEFLGVSVRALERYVSAGRLASFYERGKTGKVLAFDADELKRFKAELEAPEERPRQAPTNALARLGDANQSAAIEVLARLMEVAQNDATSADRRALSVPIEAKPLLSLSEAGALTGLSRATLRVAIDGGALKAQRIGRGWKIKRADLDLWIEKL